MNAKTYIYGFAIGTCGGIGVTADTWKGVCWSFAIALLIMAGYAANEQRKRDNAERKATEGPS